MIMRGEPVEQKKKRNFLTLYNLKNFDQERKGGVKNKHSLWEIIF